MRILIAIHGAHCQPEQMQAQRETWLRDLQATAADYKFFLGEPVSNDADVFYLPSPDGPIWEGHRRTLFLNRKTEALVRYAIDRDYDFVFKCDDDTYVRVDALLASGFEEFDYSGCTDRHWAADIGFYRWAQGGAGYWLSRRAMEIIAENGLHRARAEDFAVGQLLAANGIGPYHDDRYAPQVSEQDIESPDPRLITFHKVNPIWMRRLHRR